MLKRRFGSCLLFAVLASVLVARAAGAADDEPAEAKAHYNKATAHFAVGEYKEAAAELLKEGAVFSRPYGDLAPIVYEKAASYAHHLKRLKKVFDPNNIMNPSNLCF